MPIPMWVTRVNRKVTNPVLGTLSDRLPPLATLHHVGRRTGRRFSTPVFAFGTPRGVVIALTYGPQVQWLRNLEAGGEARLVRRGQVLAVGDPVRLHGEAGARLVPRVIRAGLRLMRVDDFVELAAVPVHG
ncbi:nitroreductase family deazaflavin-dependent oxidoreductase [Cellulomonas fengjieae]|uniref:nitroreductase family deazaflavin-dependent oxidoreductase n=1 Tax=Cellulomonas fengjieae TaxID=2819978 RepID=UPI001AAF069D|nr:nitroreductase family deazaflavin-dependent oxidoreductase [Cellulomonas fengjieae]MBO3101867.1 nitroreductase family deazaflavin-dependent oxidoreductase [Cellulomonas fengjieae]